MEEPTEAPTEAAMEEPTAEATTAPEEEATAAPEAEGTAAPEEEAMAMGDVAAGEYWVNVTGGCGCHFNRDLGARAGGNQFEGPFGVVYAANITPHPETGIGNWTDQQVADAIRLGVRADGRQLAPAMPYRRFSALSDQDVMNLVAYLRSQEPVENAVPAAELAEEIPPFTPEVAPPAESPTDPVARGEFLVTLVNCGNCHTPRNDDGSMDMTRFLAGGLVPGTEDEVAPNLTPDEETGLASWTEQDIANLLRTGIKPDGEEVGGAMAQQIERAFHFFTEEDALAISAFLKSLPPVSGTAPAAE
jgi:mono/diheme cytochrome c family protein